MYVFEKNIYIYPHIYIYTHTHTHTHIHIHIVIAVLQSQSRLTLLQLHGLQPTRLLSMGFSRQEYWSGLPFLSLGDLPTPGIKPMSPALAGGLFTTEPLGKPTYTYTHTCIGFSVL